MKQGFKFGLLAVAAGLALAGCKQNVSAGTAEKSASAAAADLGSPLQQASYAMGIDIGRTFKQMKDQGTEVDLKLFNEAVEAVVNGKEPKMTETQAQEVMMAFLTEQQQKAAAKAEEEAKANLGKGEAFLKENAAKEGVKTTASGLQYTVKTEGTGKQPKADDVVTVEYEGRLIDGTVFDSSKKQGQPVTFPLNQVIPGWTEGVQLMKEGGEYTLFIPAKLAYGEREAGDIPANSALVFDIKLVKVEPKK
ncbi:FKBP-type peptidyl-prolyl cis-trans isomerase [Neisseria leonii]|uniref:Peptidyl-prolyl cis-trans isomerase n=1 Tax=Neisseria leonii TaxID=2995413 RepID=A0A9X4IA52_9NEIS|nr:FKBP-type peptidyl-prolyl cis-trans isomerase [Neisseria sp. 51.81]MDD9327024.1 FKBP-type peptidyl-prolyl cis-trans isomerase [Neisseria sp. 51.81]